MMRQGPFVICAIVAAAVMFPTTSEAQFSVGAGLSMPTGDFTEEAERGYHVQGSAAFDLSTLPFGLRVDLLYQDFSNVEREPGINVTLGGEWFRQLGLMFNATYGIPVGIVEPYAVIGAGLTREWHGDRSYSGTSHTTFNFNAGVGVDMSLTSRLALFVEARALNLAGADALSLTPPAVNDEIHFKSVPVTIGLRF